MVCVGNICRSPMAEVILKHRVQSNLVEVSSAGLAAVVGSPADPTVHEILLEQGISCESHRARQLTSAMLHEADLILVMEEKHKKQIQCTNPNVCGKVHLLGKWDNVEVPDPYRKSKEAFKDVYELIIRGIDQWQTKLWK